jgi:hypothetical protein
MTQRIAEADGGRVWMVYEAGSASYFLFTEGHCIEAALQEMVGTRWFLTGEDVDLFYTEADAVCLLWSKA